MGNPELNSPTRSTYSIDVDGLNAERRNEIQACIDYLADVEQWTDPVARRTSEIYRVAGNRKREIRAEGHWPDVCYTVIDLAVDPNEGPVIIANLQFEHDGLKAKLKQQRP